MSDNHVCLYCGCTYTPNQAGCCVRCAERRAGGTLEGRVAALEKRVAELERRAAEAVSAFPKIGPGRLPAQPRVPLSEDAVKAAAKELLAKRGRLPRHPLDPDWLTAKDKNE